MTEHARSIPSGLKQGVAVPKFSPPYVSTSLKPDGFVKENGEILDTTTQESKNIVHCDWRSTLFQVESLTLSTESAAESDITARVLYHPEWYSVGYLTDGRYNSSTFLKILAKPQTCDELPSIVRHSMPISSELECGFNVHFSTKVALQAAEIERCSYQAPLALVSAEFTPTSFGAYELQCIHRRAGYNRENFYTAKANYESTANWRCLSVDCPSAAKEPSTSCVHMQLRETGSFKCSFHRPEENESKSLQVAMQICLHHRLYLCKWKKIPLLRHRYPRVLRVLPNAFSVAMSEAAVPSQNILVRIKPTLNDTISNSESKFWNLGNKPIKGLKEEAIKRLESFSMHTLEVLGSMQKTVRSLRLSPRSLTNEEETIPLLEPVSRDLQKGPPLPNSKVLLAGLKTVPSRSEFGQNGGESRLNASVSKLNNYTLKSLAGHISERPFFNECFGPNIHQSRLPHVRREARLTQQIEVIPHNITEVEVVNDKSCTGRSENRSHPDGSTSPCLSFYLIPERRHSGQITLDVKCCPASSKAMLNALPADGANHVECRFLKLISQKRKFHRNKALRLRKEECNIATPSPPQNYCAITLND